MSGPAQINGEIRRRLSALVTSKGIPVSDMAKAIGVDDRRMRRLLDGTNPLSAAELVMCARHLDVLTSVVVGEAPYGAQIIAA